MRNGNSQVVSNIAYALADLGYFEKRVFDAVAGQVERIAREGSEQALSNILWYEHDGLREARDAQEHHWRVSNYGTVHNIEPISARLNDLRSN